MIEVTLKIRLTLEGPILSHSTTAGSYGIDSPMYRNADGCYALPGSLIKGRLREAMAELRQKAGEVYNPDIEELFGQQTGNREAELPDIRPRRGRLQFDDFVSDTPDSQKDITRIKIDPDLGAVNHGMLQVMEAPWASRERAAFKGAVSFITSNEESGTLLEKQILIGLRWINGLGSNRSVGFGNLISVEIDCKCTKNLLREETSADEPTGSFDLVIIPLSPFCVARHCVAENIFESERIIPGNVIKGCLAEQWRKLVDQDSAKDVSKLDDPNRQELLSNFDKIRFTHAFPAPAASNTRPIVAPLSIVKVNKRLYDIAMHDNAIAITIDEFDDNNDKKLKLRMAPAFQIDWKDFSDTEQAFGWETPELSLTTELRVRTSIDSVKRKADEGKLFAQEMIVPKGFEWYSSVDLDAIKDPDMRAKVAGQLQGLLAHGLRGLGKTKTRAKVKVIHSYKRVRPKFDSSVAPTKDGVWIITLQTPAILCNPYEMNEQSRREELCRSYKNAWADISDGSIEMSHYFAAQSLAGGFYLHRRFRTDDKSTYYPFLLTNPGSVFVLKKVNDRAQELINDWLKHGLPLPGWAKERYATQGSPGEDWRFCPYIRQNGFGEIAVNLQHSIDAPKEKEYDVIKSLVD